MPARERGAYYPALDGIRALSVLLVMSFHIHSGSALVRQIPGWAGVDCFCVLSGFLITTLLIREESSTGHIRLGAFYIRRFFRIVPVFFTALLLYVPVAYFGEHGARWELFKHSVPLYLTFMQDFVSHDAPLSASWTLGIEEKFYALWPLLGFVILKRNPRSRAAIAAILFSISASLFLIYEKTSLAAYFHARSYAALALGSLLACLLASESLGRYMKRMVTASTILPVAALMASFLLVGLDRKYVLLFDASVAWGIAQHALSTNPVQVALKNPVMVWLGQRSYAMYLLHLLILNPLRAFAKPRNTFSELLILLLAYFLTAGLAHLMFLTVERPARQLGLRLIAKTGHRTAAQRGEENVPRGQVECA
jgi:peptidoglycan/LPS O-acetylase OafA/YrhL